VHIPDAQAMSTLSLQFPLPSQVAVVSVPCAHDGVPQAVPSG
jgi:hypothetical protein